MRLSIARVPADEGTTPSDTVNRDDTGFDVHGAAWRRMALALAAALILGCVGILFGTPKSAGADTTVFQSGDVFASVGNSTVYAFDAASGDQVATLQDNTGEPYTAGSAFDADGNFYVTDDINGDISEFSPTGVPLPTFATGLSNPLSIVFDNSGNMYVGQQSTPYIAEFASDGTRLPDIGPLQTELYGDDWIDLASDECTFYYTTEGTDILTYNKCTNTQGPDFNKVPFPSQDSSTGLPVNAFQLKILAERRCACRRLECRPPVGLERERHPDVSLLIAAQLRRSALRDQRRSQRDLVLDRRFIVGIHLPDQHRNRRS